MKKNETESIAVNTPEEVRDAIEKQLETALASWRGALGEKRFKKRIKKAGKLFGRKLNKTTAKALTKNKDSSTDKKSRAA